MHKIFIMALMVLALSACEELGFGGKKEYNVFYIPDGKGTPVFVGKAQGIRDCRQLANMRRQQMNRLRVDNDYVCCLITPESPCAERKQ